MKSVSVTAWFTTIILGICPGIYAAVDLELDGLGWRSDRRHERLLEDVLDIRDRRDAALDAAMVEDALVILGGELGRNGYLSPEIKYTLYKGKESIISGSWDFNTQLHGYAWQDGDRVVFDVRRGVRAHVVEVYFEGLDNIPLKEARSYFIPTGGLVVPKASRAYSPMKLESQMRSLRQKLGQLGYQDARVKVSQLPEVGENGEVNVSMHVTEGARFIWGNLSCVSEPADGVGKHVMPALSGNPFNTESLQDLMAQLRKQYLVAGYPDVSISIKQERLPVADRNEVIVNVELAIEPGPRVRLGEVEFKGVRYTKEHFLRRHVRLSSGSWLNRPEVQSAQFRLGQLGIFGRVNTEYKESINDLGAPVRDVSFSVTERQRQRLSMLLGYGSYERLRIGVEARAINLLGRAHSGHIRLRQSMRSSAGALFYTIPRPVSWLSSGQLRLQGLLREEVSFDREEALAAIGVERNFLEGSLRTTAEYRYELLQSKGFTPISSIGDTNTAAGSLNFGFSWDSRDQVVSPKKGASLQGILELASTAIGSESNYQRLIVRSSYHHSFDNGWLRSHLGLEGGMLSRLGSSPFEFPTNKRFFPGGENSIRGYQEGGASPLDPEGYEIGAEAYLIGHVELEVLLSESLSIVLFSDGLWSTPYLDSPSTGESLFSTGLGLRYSTPLGPLRLEYGHNLNPRPSDPDGTLHLSIGFPF